MRAVIQRVTEASVHVGEDLVGSIPHGMLVLLGVAEDDNLTDATFLADKVAGLRIFEDSAGKMNLSVRDVGGSILAVSQFTLLGDCRKGRRPSFVSAAPPQLAEALYEQFVTILKSHDIPVEQGRFRASMSVALVNDGPVTLMLDSRRQF